MTYMGSPPTAPLRKRRVLVTYIFALGDLLDSCEDYCNYCTAQHFTVLYCIVLYCTMLFSIVLYCSILIPTMGKLDHSPKTLT